MDLQVQQDEDERDSAAGDRVEVRSAAGAVREGELADARGQVAALESSLANQARAHADLIHLLGHELRTPITVIGGFARLLLDSAHGSLSERQLGFVHESLKACRRLDLLVGDLLEASPESGTALAVHLERANLNATIYSNLESLSPLLMERRMRVDLDLDATLPEFDFDELRIEQVLTNLMTNAIRYGRVDGTIGIATELHERDGEDGAFVAIHVEDDGPGIAEVDRIRVFKPYVRGEGHSICAGMGIGLAICQRIVASHDGSIHVDESPLGGARFTFELPLVRCSTQEK